MIQLTQEQIMMGNAMKPKHNNGELIECPICNVAIYENNLAKHKRLIHGSQ